MHLNLSKFFKVPGRSFLLASLLLFLSNHLYAQANSSLKEYNRSYVTYTYSDPNPIPTFRGVYPYFKFDGFTNKPINKDWKVVELENDYVKVLIFPEIGGKIWTAIEKKTNHAFIYNNNVVKFRDIAIRGPWTSGGIEFNFGVLGHAPNCSTPVDYKVLAKDDGSVSCYIGAFDLMTRSYWRAEINLPKDKAYFSTDIVWYNASGVNQPYYHWMNAGLKATDDLEFTYPGNKYIEHDGEQKEWPFNTKHNKNIKFYKENNFGPDKSYHIFGKHTNFSGAYWHNDSYGMVRFAERDVKLGTKLWIWALSESGKIWEDLLTDKDGQYMELQSGRLFNQNVPNSAYTPFKGASFAPYAVDIWNEYWYPILNTDGLLSAEKSGALNIYKKENNTILKFSATKFIDDSARIYLDDKLYKTFPVKLKPLDQFSENITSSFEKIRFELKAENFVYDSKAATDTIKRPSHTLDGFDWKSAQGYYLLGQDAMDRNDYKLAETNFLNSLNLEPNNMQSLLGISKVYYRNARYEEALENVSKVLSLNAYESDANYYYGLINNSLGNAIDAKDGFEVATISQKNRTASYVNLSSVYFNEQNLSLAIDYANKALKHNNQNIAALSNLALFYRAANKRAEAMTVLNKIKGIDYLNHFVSAEMYFWDKNKEKLDNIKGLITNELAYESYLELALYYYNLGRDNDALSVLNMSPLSTENEIWKLFLKKEKVDFNKLNIDFTFPFRAETLALFESLSKTTSHWKLSYLTSLVYLSMNRPVEACALLDKYGDQPDFAPFYAIRAQLNPGNAETELKRAMSIDKNWRYVKMLGDFYNKQGMYQKTVDLLKKDRKYAINDMMGMLYINSLIFTKKYAAAETLLANLKVLPYEGADVGRLLYRNAKLFQAVDLLKVKKNSKANNFIQQSKIWSTNLGVGRPYDDEMDVRIENWLSYLASNRTDKTFLNEILDFTPKIEGNVYNFYAENTWVTLLAYEETGQEDKALEWLKKHHKECPYDKDVEAIHDYYLEHRSVKKYFQDSNANHDQSNLLLSEMFKL